MRMDCFDSSSSSISIDSSLYSSLPFFVPTPSKSTSGSCELSAYSSFHSLLTFFVSYQHFLIVQIVVQIIHEFWTRRIQPFLLLQRPFPRHTPAPRGLRSTLVPRGIQRRRGRRQIPGNVHVYAGIRARNRRPRSTLDPRGNAYRRFRVAR